MSMRKLVELCETPTISGFCLRSSYGNNASSIVDSMFYSSSPQQFSYASAPMVSATIPASRGFGVRPDGGFIKSFSLSAYRAGATNNGRVFCAVLCDYLLYYPFLDASVFGEQVLTNSITLPRYADGAGVMATAIWQGSPATDDGAVGSFRIRYINQDGVEKTSPSNHICPAQTDNGSNPIDAGAVLMQNFTRRATASPFITLAAGDSGIRSVQAVEVLSSTTDGAFVIVLVKPLLDLRSILYQETPASLNTTGYVKFDLGEDGVGVTNLVRFLPGACLRPIITNLSNAQENRTGIIETIGDFST